MPTHLSTEQGVVVIEPSGGLDVPDAEAFEQQTLDVFNRGARFFVIGFEKVDLITSTGIRVLLELHRKLQPYRGTLILYGLNDRLKTVLRMTRLIDQFEIVVSKEEAMLAIAARRASLTEGAASLSSLTRLVGQVVGSAPRGSTAGHPLAPDGLGSQKSALTSELARLLAEAGPDRPV